MMKIYEVFVQVKFREWVHSTHKNVQDGKNNVVKGSISATVTKNDVVALQMSQRNMPTTIITKGKII